MSQRVLQSAKSENGHSNGHNGHAPRSAPVQASEPRPPAPTSSPAPDGDANSWLSQFVLGVTTLVAGGGHSFATLALAQLQQILSPLIHAAVGLKDLGVPSDVPDPGHKGVIPASEVAVLRKFLSVIGSLPDRFVEVLPGGAHKAFPLDATRETLESYALLQQFVTVFEPLLEEAKIATHVRGGDLRATFKPAYKDARNNSRRDAVLRAAMKEVFDHYDVPSRVRSENQQREAKQVQRKSRRDNKATELQARASEATAEAQRADQRDALRTPRRK